MKIQDFFDTLTLVNNAEIYVVKSRELEIAEHDLGQHLPEDYKYFCSHIGTCTTESNVNLFAMDDIFLSYGKEVKEGCSEEIRTAIEELSQQNLGNVVAIESGMENFSLLESSVFFATASPRYWFLMNLERSVEQMDNCDIFLYDVYYPMKKANKVATGFTDFVCNFCYGKPIVDIFYAWYDFTEVPRIYYPEAIIPFYRRIDSDNSVHGVAGDD
jgi:SMI1 / KNR4 family (SUKH-1)